MKWELIAKRENDFFKNCLMYEALVEDFVKVWNMPFCDVLTMRKDMTFTHYMNLKTNNFSKFVFEKTRKEKDFIKRVVNDGKRYFEELISFCRNLNNLDTKSNNELLSLIKNYIKLYKRIYPNFFITISASEFEKAKDQRNIDELAKFRLYSRDTYEKIHSLSYCLFEEIGKRFGLTVYQIKFLTPEEIESLLKLEKVDVEAKLKERKTCFFIHIKGNFIFSHDSMVILNYENLEFNETEIKGMIAFKGDYKGKVRLIEKAEDMKFLKKGEVLVARMTMPDFITSKFNNAGAIITDEGGITCHAAIVSREFKIPCIIGTKVATKILRTGDLVKIEGNTVKKL